jgi:hypothetical protein
MKIYVVQGYITYEGLTLLNVFSEKFMAESFVRRCKDYSNTPMPSSFIDGVYDDRNVLEWACNHPAKSDAYDDYLITEFAVIDNI